MIHAEPNGAMGACFAVLVAVGRKRMERRREIKQFVLQNFLFCDNEGALSDHDSLIRGGIVDSTGIHELILFLEESYQISVSPDEMTPTTFDSIHSVDEFVTRKLSV